VESTAAINQRMQQTEHRQKDYITRQENKFNNNKKSTTK